MEHTHKTPEDLHFVPQVFTLTLAAVPLCINYVFRLTFWSETEPYSFIHHCEAEWESLPPLYIWCLINKT